MESFVGSFVLPFWVRFGELLKIADPSANLAVGSAGLWKCFLTPTALPKHKSGRLTATSLSRFPKEPL